MNIRFETPGTALRPALLLGALASFSAAQAPASVTGSAAPAVVASHLLDIDGDGAQDLLLQHADHSLSVRLNTGARSFASVPQVLPKIELTDVLLTDLDGDGQNDLFLVSPAPDVALVGDGSGRFREATRELGLLEQGVGISAERLDVDGDGLLDLVVHNQGSDVLFWAEPAGGFVRDALTLSVAPHVAVVRIDTPPRSADPIDSADVAPSALGGRSNALAATAGAPSARQPTGTTQTVVAAPTTSFQAYLDPIYVNDNAGEVDSADIADGSLTGADVSTSSGDVTFAGAVLTARQGVFGVGSVTNGSGSTISGGANNGTSGLFSVVSGGLMNGTQGDHSVVGGGLSNLVQGDRGTIAGGEFNFAGYPHSTIGGGMGNVTMGPLTAIAGGENNRAGYTYTTIGGGKDNTTSGDYSTICGGEGNMTGGAWSCTLGGHLNLAGGAYSVAAGLAAQAFHDGAFVWADSTAEFKSSSADDQFNVFADGGVRMFAEGATTPSFEVSDLGKVRITDGTEGQDLVLTSDANGEASWGPKISYGTYTPTWTNLEGMTGAPFTIEAHYTRVGSMVTVLAVNNFPTFAVGTNRATISLPPGLPVASGFPNGFLVSGTFTNDWYRHGSEQNCGAVVHEDGTHVRLVLMNASQSGGATAYCNFTYLTDAP